MKYNGLDDRSLAVDDVQRRVSGGYLLISEKMISFKNLIKMESMA